MIFTEEEIKEMNTALRIANDNDAKELARSILLDMIYKLNEEK